MSDIEWATLLIHVSIGLVMIAFGLHQIVRPGDWKEYIPPWLARLIIIPRTSFLQMHGVGNLAFGLAYAIGFLPGIFDWVVLAWWVTILPFAVYVKWSIAARDVAIIASIAAVLLLRTST